MMSAYTWPVGLRQRRAALAALVLLVAGALWVPVVDARVRVSGANGCGSFRQTVLDAVDGNFLLPMYDNNEGRNSEGATIDKNLSIEGGWAPPATCPTAQGEYPKADPAGLLALGFSYLGPGFPSRLNASGVPVVTYASNVTSASVYDMVFAQALGGVGGNGGAVLMDGLSDAQVRFENVTFINTGSTSPTATGLGGGLYLKVGGGSQVQIDGGSASGLGAGQRGGGMYLEVDGGSTLTISNMAISDNLAAGGGGGGIELVVKGGSTVVLRGLTVSDNVAAGNGAGMRVVLHSGTVLIADSHFSGNSTSAGSGALAIERAAGATGPATVQLVNTTFSGNSAPGEDDLFTSGSGLTVQSLPARVYLPVATQIPTPAAQISAISRSGNTYATSFTTTGYTPQDGGLHVHFFFDSVPPDQAGVPGAGPWFMYFGGSPFTGYGIANRPFGARQLCILVANADHSIQPGTGNCTRLP